MQKPFQLACVDRETKYSILSKKINTFLTCLAETIFFKIIPILRHAYI